MHLPRFELFIEKHTEGIEDKFTDNPATNQSNIPIFVHLWGSPNLETL